MGEEDPPPHLANRIMGMIADRLRQQLTEMRERHAQTDRELAQLRAEAWEAYHVMEAAQERMEAALDAM